MQARIFPASARPFPWRDALAGVSAANGAAKSAIPGKGVKGLPNELRLGHNILP
jgi:hypothetical protein